MQSLEKVRVVENIEIEKDWTKEYFRARGFELAVIVSKNKKASFYNVRKKNHEKN